MPSKITTHMLFALVLSSVIVAAIWQAGFIAVESLPVLRWATGVFARHYDVIDFVARRQGSDDVFWVQLGTRSDRIFEAGTLPAGTTIDSSTLAAHLLVDLVLLAIAHAYLGLYQRESPVMLVIAFVLGVPLIIALDIPLVLLGAVDDVILSTYAPEQQNLDVSVIAMRFLNHGGRTVLALMLPVLLVHLQRLLWRRMVAGNRSPSDALSATL